MKGLLIDLDGVLYEGERMVPGAADAMAWVVEQGIPHRFVTNTTSRPRAALVEKLGRLGIATRIEQFFTPAVAVSQWLAEAQLAGRPALVVPDATKVDLPSPWEEGESERMSAVVLGDVGEGWNYALLNQLLGWLLQDPPPALLALGMTRYWQAEDGLRIDVGAMVKALEYASGHEAVVLGKPARAFFDAAVSQLGVAREDVWMIGDDIRGDVDGAQRAGLKAVLVRTGKFRPSDLNGSIRPDAVLDSITELPEWWAEAGKQGGNLSEEGFRTD